MNWSDLQVFMAVSRAGSHAKAARMLRVDATTIGRRLDALERDLGARLFDRTPQGLVPTAAGAAIIPRAERAEAELLAIERETSGLDARVVGTVRITAGDGLVHTVLAPAVPALRARHPDLVVELRADTRSLDLSRREADIALRLARPTEPALVARKLATMRFGVYASRSYLERHGTPRKLADAASHAWIGYEAELDDVPQNRWLRRHIAKPRYVMRATTTSAQLAACRAGVGLALLPTFVAADLVAIAARTQGPERDLWLVMHGDLRRNARVAAAVDWLESGVLLGVRALPTT